MLVHSESQPVLWVTVGLLDYIEPPPLPSIHVPEPVVRASKRTIPSEMGEMSTPAIGLVVVTLFGLVWFE